MTKWQETDWTQLGYDTVTDILSTLTDMVRWAEEIGRWLSELSTDLFEQARGIDWGQVGSTAISAIVAAIQFDTQIRDALLGLARGAWDAVKDFFGNPFGMGGGSSSTGGGSRGMGGSSRNGVPYIPQNYTGDNFFGGGLTWVGERGPELVSLPTSRIYNNDTSQRIASVLGGGGASDNSMSLHIDKLIVGDPNDAFAIEDSLTTATQNWRRRRGR